MCVFLCFRLFSSAITYSLYVLQSPDAKTLASLVLPSQIKRTTTPAPTSAASPSQSTSNSASNRTITASPIPSRSSTPTISSSTAYRNPINPAPAPPPLDTSRANEICNYQELDLSLLSLEQLRALKEEMEGFRMSVSIRLEFELGVREKEVGDGEAYHVMIQVSRLFLYSSFPTSAFSFEDVVSDANQSCIGRISLRLLVE